MGQNITRLYEKYIGGNESPSSSSEDKKPLEYDSISSEELTSKDYSRDNDKKFEDSMISMDKILTNQDSAKTPKNLVKLQCDPRSPSSFDRTPLRVPKSYDDMKVGSKKNSLLAATDLDADF